MGRLAIVLLGMLGAAPAAAQDHALRGQWEVRPPAIPGFKGSVLIDSEGRATWDDFVDERTTSTRFIGYVAKAEDANVLAKFTNRKNVVDMHCTVHSSDLLHCYIVRDSGWTGPPFALVRTGPGPASLWSSR